MFEKMTLREWSASSTPTSTHAPGLLSLAEPDNNDSIVSVCVDVQHLSYLLLDIFCGCVSSRNERIRNFRSAG